MTEVLEIPVEEIVTAPEGEQVAVTHVEHSEMSSQQPAAVAAVEARPLERRMLPTVRVTPGIRAEILRRAAERGRTVKR